MAIKLYWVLIPKSKRRKCLFKTSCSNYVFAHTTKNGLFSGMKALKYRVDNCNPNYSLIHVNKELVLVTKANNVFKREELSDFILE